LTKEERDQRNVWEKVTNKQKARTTSVLSLEAKQPGLFNKAEDYRLD